MKKPDVYYTGEDKVLQCALTDDTGAVISLATYSNIVAWVYSFTDKTVLAKYSMIALADHDNTNFVVTSIPGGTFNIQMLAAVTANAIEDYYYIEFKAKEVAGINFKPIHLAILCEYKIAQTKLILN